MKTLIELNNDYCKLRINVIFKCEYAWRTLLLVKTTGLVSGNEHLELFYVSAGMSTPDICEEGSIRPIFGIYDSNFKNMYNAIQNLWPKLDPDYDEGWIAKYGSKDKNDPNTWLQSKLLRMICEELEKYDLDSVYTLDYKSFATLIDSLYSDKNFGPASVYMVNKK